MVRLVLVGAGLLITVAGVVFTLQGVGVIGGPTISPTMRSMLAPPIW